MKQITTVAVGQRYQSIGTVSGAPIYGYEVQAVFRSKVDQIDYARLSQIDEPTRVKSVSTATLLNRRQFIPLDATTERRPH